MSTPASEAPGPAVHFASDYGSLAAAITAVPPGGTLQLAANTTYQAAALSVLSKTITIEGEDSRSSIIDAGAHSYGFQRPAGWPPAFSVTFRNVGFVGSAAAQIRLYSDVHSAALFVSCRFSNFSQYAIENNGSNLLCVGCDFSAAGSGKGTAIFHRGGSQRITLRDCTFRYLFRGLYCTDVDGSAKRVVVRGCTFDGGWFLLKARGGGSGAVSYTSTSLTDPTARLDRLAVNTTVRALTVKGFGTATVVESRRLTDAAADFRSAAVGRGDLIRIGDRFGLVDELMSSTVVSVEKWIDNATYEDKPPPASDTPYVLSGLIIGRVVANTATVVRVDRWRDWLGSVVTPPDGTPYELVPKADYQCFVFGADHVTIAGNTFLRSWADQIAPLASRKIVVVDNNISDGQDVGITIQGSGHYEHDAVVTGNRISHQGTAGIWSDMAGVNITGNAIVDANWMSGPDGTYAAITLALGSAQTLVADNTIRRLHSPNAVTAIQLAGDHAGVTVQGNSTSGYDADGILRVGPVVPGPVAGGAKTP